MSMQLLEIKNDIAKILYNPADNKLLPSDFLLIKDSNQKLVGQILSVYTTENSTNNIADVRLALYIDKDEKLSYYNGYIPPKSASVLYITTDEITEMIADYDSNIYLGNLTFHPRSFVKVPMSLVNERLYIQCDREDNTKMIVQNIVSALYMKQKKVVLLDFDGRYNRILNVPRLVISESFKFPLNIDAFNNILEYDTVDCPIEDRAVIQSIVLELRDYIRTLDNKFLPFNLFKNVVISEFSSNPISGLMVLRNKLWQYAQEGLFAESKADFDIINTVLKNENIVIIDASKIEEKWHKFTIETIPKILNRHCYFAFSMNDIVMDKRSIINLYNNSNIVPIVSTSYDSPSRNVLKSLSKNQILFKPSKQTEVDEQYGALIHKLNNNDFILYGEASLNLPLIIDLKPFDIKTSESVAEQEIRRNVDKILSTGKSMLPKEAVITEPQDNTASSEGSYIVDEDFTDEDLDFLDNIKKEKISIEDLRNQKINDEPNDGYNLFDPFTEIEKAQETVQNSVSPVPQDISSNNLTFDFDDLLNNNDSAKKADEEIIEQNMVSDFTVNENNYEQVDNEIVESREDVLDTPIKDLIVNDNEKSSEDNNTIDMDVLPELSTLNQNDGIKYKDINFDEEGSDIGYVDNLVIEDIQGFGFENNNPPSDKNDENIIENDFLVEDLSENQTLNSENEKKNSEFEQDEPDDFYEKDEETLINSLSDNINEHPVISFDDDINKFNENSNEAPSEENNEDSEFINDFVNENEINDINSQDNIQETNTNLQVDLNKIFYDFSDSYTENNIKEDNNEESIETELLEQQEKTDTNEDFIEYDNEQIQILDKGNEEDNTEVNDEENVSFDDELFLEENIEEEYSKVENSDEITSNIDSNEVNSEENQFDNIEENTVSDIEEEFISLDDELFNDETEIKQENPDIIVENNTNIETEEEILPDKNNIDYEEINEEQINTSDIDEEIFETNSNTEEEINTEEENSIDSNNFIEDEFSEPENIQTDVNEQNYGNEDEITAFEGVEENIDEYNKEDIEEPDFIENNVQEEEPQNIETDFDEEQPIKEEINTEVEEKELKIKKKPVKSVKSPQKEKSVSSIDNIIENIKIQAIEKEKKKKLKEKDKIKQEKPEKKNITKNVPPPPVQVTNEKINKKTLTVYETDLASDIVTENTLPFKIGDKVYHPKHGKGVIEGFANYSNKILFCQIEFENVGRRILDPRISGLEKID